MLKFGGQIAGHFPEFGRQIFLKALLKILSQNLRSSGNSTLILKISWKNIETLLSSIVLSEISFANIANWDMGDFVHFLPLFEHRIHS